LDLISQTSSFAGVIAPEIRYDTPMVHPLGPNRECGIIHRHGNGRSVVDLPPMKEYRCLVIFTLKMTAPECIIRLN
jgi:hypothetical protein